MQHQQIPVLITWDVDPDRWARYEDRQRALSIAIDLCEEFDIRSTSTVGGKMKKVVSPSRPTVIIAVPKKYSDAFTLPMICPNRNGW